MTKEELIERTALRIDAGVCDRRAALEMLHDDIVNKIAKWLEDYANEYIQFDGRYNMGNLTTDLKREMDD